MENDLYEILGSSALRFHRSFSKITMKVYSEDESNKKSTTEPSCLLKAALLIRKWVLFSLEQSKAGLAEHNPENIDQHIYAHLDLLFPKNDRKIAFF